jgi:hypothetical protein
MNMSRVNLRVVFQVLLLMIDGEEGLRRAGTAGVVGWLSLGGHYA